MNKLKTMTLTLASAGILAASPVYTADGVNALPDDGLGKKVFATPGSSWTVEFEDLIDQGDADFNDGKWKFEFSPGINDGFVQGIVEYLGGLSAHTNTLTVPGGVVLGAPSYFAQFTTKAHVEVPIQFNDVTSGATWFVGPPGYNSDRKAHAIVHELNTVATPEPRTFWILAISLLLFGTVAACRRADRKRWHD